MILIVAYKEHLKANRPTRKPKVKSRKNSAGCEEPSGVSNGVH